MNKPQLMKEMQTDRQPMHESYLQRSRLHQYHRFDNLNSAIKVQQKKDTNARTC